jgi:hypothetical protein
MLGLTSWRYSNQLIDRGKLIVGLANSVLALVLLFKHARGDCYEKNL